MNLAYGLHKNLELIDRKNFLGLSVLNIAKSSYFEIPLKLMILFKSNSRPLTLFSEYLHYIIEANGPDIIQDDFDIDAHQKSRILLHFYCWMSDHCQKNAHEVASDKRLIDNNISCFEEAQVQHVILQVPFNCFSNIWLFAPIIPAINVWILLTGCTIT